MANNKKKKRFLTKGGVIGLFVGLVLIIGGFFTYNYFSCGNAPTNGECAWSVSDNCAGNCAEYSRCCNGTCNRVIPCLTGCAKEKNKCIDNCHDCCEAKFEACDAAYDENGPEWYRCTEELGKCRKACGYKWQ